MVGWSVKIEALECFSAFVGVLVDWPTCEVVVIEEDDEVIWLGSESKVELPLVPLVVLPLLLLEEFC